MTDTRRPIHLAVMVGASTALYAMSMAGVTRHPVERGP